MQYSIRRIRALKRKRGKALRKTLEKLKRYLVERSALKIILFGSYAQGVVRSGTDLDILCVMPPYKTGRDWMAEIYGGAERDVDCDILAYTEEELEKTYPVSSFLRHALETGRVIYEERPKG